MIDDHEMSLKELLSENGFQWIDRKNPAMKFPTDFALIRAPGTTLEAVSDILGKIEVVRDVHAERIIEKDLKSVENNVDINVLEDRLTSFQPCNLDRNATAYKYCVKKRPGRILSRPTLGLDENFDSWHINNDSEIDRNRRKLQQTHSLPEAVRAVDVWNHGYSGKGVKVGVFDTGIKKDHPDVKNIDERTNWTHENTLDDGLGHGSFVAGVIAGIESGCPGIAPDVSLNTFRVFTNDQVSFTSWFLDAFNYAIATKMDLVNLSIGGPDYLDAPFVDKVREVTGAGIVMVSAIGNDGPFYGSLNNPADQDDVIGVGGISWDDSLASFSSRGMTTWELPLGYGRSKPDIVAPGKEVKGSRIAGGCRSLSGTSVASPVVAGAAALLISTVDSSKKGIVNPASIKQVLLEGAKNIEGLHIYEQGQGKLDVAASFEILQKYEPRASVVPAELNLAECELFWPHCKQPIYYSSMPLIFNATILNGMGVVGKLEGPPQWIPVDEGGKLLDVRFDFAEQLWPWSGHLALFIRVKPDGKGFSGEAKGKVAFTVISPPMKGESIPRRSSVVLPVTASIIPTPERTKRLLWDQFHSIRYPPGYFPRDDLSVRHDILDWHGDHLHTNFYEVYNSLRDAGYFIEVLASPLTCFEASNYGAIIMVDSEDEFYPEEISKLEKDVKDHGLGLIIFSDWYDLETLRNLRFYDDNTRSWWESATGGANIPALNDLLAPYGIAFAGGILDDTVKLDILGIKPFKMASGSSIGAFPSGGYLFNASSPVIKNSGRRLEQQNGQNRDHQSLENNSIHEEKFGAPVLGLTTVGSGRVIVYGDSNCLDSSHQKSKCYDFLLEVVQYATKRDSKLLNPLNRLNYNFGSLDPKDLPMRRDDFNFTEVSFVLQNQLVCYANSPLEHQGLVYQGPEANQPELPAIKVEKTKSHDYQANIEEVIDQEMTPTLSDTAGSWIETTEEMKHDPVLWLHGGQQPSDSKQSNAFSFPSFNLVRLSQVFSLIGGAALIALWSLGRRRKQNFQADGVLPNGTRNGRAYTLPIVRE